MDDLEISFVMRADRERRRRRDIEVNLIRLRSVRDASDPFSVTNEIFKGVYRISKELAKELIKELHPLMVAPRRSSAIPIEIKVLCALHFYAQGSYQKSAGSDTNLGLCQSSVSCAVEEVTAALNTREILMKWICFPRMQVERGKAITKNFKSSQIPGVIGYVDGTHVAIRALAEDEHVFLNRKSFHSLNVMIVSENKISI
ncbi:hypothetical protein J437_LFUL013874 [Ladona fulva]|uniref:Nuclease HARBI1 n=1 Tax=Ladona fulva TaxID=123851 RepID=A0A8K0P8W8_LADFU|nr:hypothetical protein J437_LFUL013874 [Ladona fulva]